MDYKYNSFLFSVSATNSCILISTFPLFAVRKQIQINFGFKNCAIKMLRHVTSSSIFTFKIVSHDKKYYSFLGEITVHSVCIFSFRLLAGDNTF